MRTQFITRRIEILAHPFQCIYVARVAPLGFFYTCLRSAPALFDKFIVILNDSIDFVQTKEQAEGKPVWQDDLD